MPYRLVNFNTAPREWQWCNRFVGRCVVRATLCRAKPTLANAGAERPKGLGNKLREKRAQSFAQGRAQTNITRKIEACGAASKAFAD
jgi:hypothetical protein